MRTVGEILKKKRQDKNISLEDVEKNIKIRKKYLDALENNDWNKLPSLAYIKGFLKNYSRFLNLPPEETLAIFRRQYEYGEKGGLLPEGVTKPLNEPFIRLTPRSIIVGISALFLLLFFTYLSWQYKIYVSPPTLKVEKPLEGEVFSLETVEISGSTDRDAVLEINNKKVALEDNGRFLVKMDFTPGVNTLVISSISKYGKKKTITRTLSIQPPSILE